MTVVITRLFDTYDEAAKSVADLESSGIPHSEISIVANNTEGRLGDYPATAATPSTVTSSTAYADEDAPVDAAPASGAGTGATIGTVLGGGAGLLAGLGLLAIPGVGPVIAAGWLIATVTGAGIGAAGGGLLGSLVGAGVNETDAHVYAEGVRRGGTLVTVRADDGQRASVEAIFARYAGVDAATRGNEYRAGGWQRFDETAPAYTAGATPALGAMPTAAGAPVVGTGLASGDPVLGVGPVANPRV